MHTITREAALNQVMFPTIGDTVIVRKFGWVIDGQTEFAAIVTKVVDNEGMPDIWATIFPPTGHETEQGVIPHQFDTEREGTVRWRFRDEDIVQQHYETETEPGESPTPESQPESEIEGAQEAEESRDERTRDKSLNKGDKTLTGVDESKRKP